MAFVMMNNNDHPVTSPEELREPQVPPLAQDLPQQMHTQPAPQQQVPQSPYHNAPQQQTAGAGHQMPAAQTSQPQASQQQIPPEQMPQPQYPSVPPNRQMPAQQASAAQTPQLQASQQQIPPGQAPQPPYPGITPHGAYRAPPRVVKEKRVFSFAEKLLLPLALAIAILYNRLMFAPFFAWDNFYTEVFAGAFWLCYLVVFYGVYWKKLKNHRILWYVAGCAAALCIWNFFFDTNHNYEYASLTYFVIPAVLMAHAQFIAGGYSLKDVKKTAVSWFAGWGYRPFSGIPILFGAIGSLFSGENKGTAKKALIGIGITLPLLGIIIPLLSAADQMFAHYLNQIIGNFNFVSLIGHTFIVAIAFGLFYSFLWNIGYGEPFKFAESKGFTIDTIISNIVLCSVSVLYILFCLVQFTYLFARAGLPYGMTYAEYARAGFAQTVVVCAINLLIFGILLQYSAKRKSTACFLAGLLTLTAIMLFSGAVRLNLYIYTFGLTWLRVLSAWFVIYLAAVVIICAIRIKREKLPAIAICALILLGWYVLLGYLNPDGFIIWYNGIYVN